MQRSPVPEDLPPSLRFLRVLVTILTATMIIGVLSIVALLVIRLQAPAVPNIPLLPETMELPDGVSVTAFTRGQGWYALVTSDNRILIFDAASGRLTQEVAVTVAE